MLATAALVSACGGGDSGGGGGGGAPSVTLRSISVTPNPFSTGVGITRQLTATGNFSDGSAADLTASAAWNSLTPSVATVSAGAVTGAALGAATIRVSSAGVSADIPMNVTANTWSPAQSMDYVLGSLTLLPNGSAFSAGGDNLHRGDAEIYDPNKDSWSETDQLMTIGNIALLLTNGKVLSVGGVDSFEIGGLSEIYDPALGRWTTHAPMSYTRQGFTATLLADGTVLATGGTNATPTQTRYEERYDPVANQWSTVPGMMSQRVAHTATLLPDGQVLVAGGLGFNSYSFASAELYDPVANTWSPAASMATSRAEHTATLLPGGKVLVVGGETIAFAGNGSPPSVVLLSSAEIYDPTTNTWSSAGNMATARVEPATLLLPSGKVLVTGGTTTGNVALASAEIYDPGTNTWSAAGSMATALAQPAAVLLKNGTVLACGVGSTTPTPGCELYW
ncbi:kelch repeat-containing protein [Paraburkholderia sp. BL21I4N1]|uniref:kelch repeat-containing protein n=1 Tax=Paraburkholderia sp. BL21I4N1 TaxID=1938801 RepID=UPI002157FC00|nr:kelch repeat-containing protein [Paraburkholderia sp. BL21I4N1]